jgi:hypothetical protein
MKSDSLERDYEQLIYVTMKTKIKLAPSCNFNNQYPSSGILQQNQITTSVLGISCKAFPSLIEYITTLFYRVPRMWVTPTISGWFGENIILNSKLVVVVVHFVVVEC